MKKLFALLFAIASSAGVAMAGVGFPAPGVPEINPATAIGALTLLGGSILVIRARLKK